VADVECEWQRTATDMPLFCLCVEQKAQGRMLANVIKYIITNLKEADETILCHSLKHLARVHNKRGITADQYSVMGMCLVHTVRICTGPSFWTATRGFISTAR
jgi:hemoglobin-like flavoprotein